MRRPERSRHHSGRTRFLFRGGAGGTAGGGAGTLRSLHSLQPLHSFRGHPAIQFILHHWAHWGCCGFCVVLGTVEDGAFALAAGARDQSASHCRQSRVHATRKSSRLRPAGTISVFRCALPPNGAHRAGGQRPAPERNRIVAKLGLLRVRDRFGPRRYRGTRVYQYSRPSLSVVRYLRLLMN